MDLFGLIAINIRLFWDSIQLIELLNPVLSFIGVCISAIVLKATINSINEQNRPFISFSIEPSKKVKNFFIVIRNTGNRTANNVIIKTTPKLVSICSEKRNTPSIISDKGEISLSGVSPNQIIKTFFDSGLYRYKENPNEISDKFEISISYKFKKRKFVESVILDLTYLRHVCSLNTPEDIDTNIKKIADNIESINKKIK
ncbi:MAG: hypothetical protein PHR06_00570 [Candidatus Cloacimonetes bacterium]|nr:hypothetical protein [Candidatus Cloacimonadota bacterium]